MSEQLTQEKLAELIRAGYKKHNLKGTNVAYYDREKHTACPIFAAFSFFFDTAAEAYLPEHEKSFYSGISYTEHMAKKSMRLSNWFKLSAICMRENQPCKYKILYFYLN